MLLFAALLVAAPQKVTAGIYVSQIGGVDLKANTFSVEFWLWFRSRDLPVSPIDTFELIDGRVEARTNVIKKKLPDGQDYGAAKITARVHQQFDLHRFPLDDHSLRITIEDADLDVTRLVYEADPASQGLDPQVAVAGWDLTGFAGSVGEHTYASNYGDTSMQPTFSGYSVNINAKRSSLARFFKVAFALVVSVLVSWCAFFIDPSVGARVSIPIGALFAASAGSIAINSQLPDVNYLTMIDYTIFVSLGFIVIALIVSVLALALPAGATLRRRLDSIGRFAFPIVYALALTAIVH